MKSTKIFVLREAPSPMPCATTTLTRTISVAEGVFAPGHLGELTQYIPFELVDDVLEQTRTVQQRLRQLPSRVGVYFLLALPLFPSLGYARVWDKLVAGLHGLQLHRPSEKALRDLRRRLGSAPLKTLFEVLAGPLAQPSTPGVCYRRWRTGDTHQMVGMVRPLAVSGGRARPPRDPRTRQGAGQEPLASSSLRWGASAASVVVSPWPVWTTVSPGSGSSRSWMEARMVS